MGVLPAFNTRSHVNVITGNQTEGYLDNLALALPLGIGLCSLSLLTFFGNAMVVHAIRTERKLHTVSNMFILSLAIADLTVGLIVMPISSAYVLIGDWIFGLIICQLWLVIDYTASTASIFNLLILSLDRYWSIRSPLKYLCKRTKKRALGMIGIVWLISALWAIPIIGWHKWYNNGYRKHPNNVCETEFDDNVLFKLTTSAANFFIPMIAMMGLYYKIFREIKRRGKIDIGRSMSVSCANHAPNMSKSSQRKQKKLFHRNNHLRSSCASCASWNNNKKITTQMNDNVSVAKSGGSDTEREPFKDVEDKDDNRVERSEAANSKGEMEDASDSGKNECSASNLNSDATSVNGDKVKHYQQLTLMSVKPEKHPYALENYHGVKVEVEYINGGSALNVYEQVISKSCNSGDSTCGTLRKTQINSDDKCDKRERIKCKSKSKKSVERTPSSSSSYSLRLTSLKKKKAQIIANSESIRSNREARPSIALPLNEYCSECQCTAAAAAAATHHQNALRREESSRLRQEKKAARQLGVILGAFTLCWMPYLITFVVTAYCTDCVSGTVHQISIWLGYINSFLNPFLYALCNENFKTAFKKMLGRAKPQYPSYNFDTHGTSFRAKNNFS